MNSPNYEEVECINCGRPFMRKRVNVPGKSRRLPNGGIKKVEDKRRCSKCKKVKLVKEFYYRSGTQEWCKECAGISSGPKWKSLTAQEAYNLLGDIWKDIIKLNGPVTLDARMAHLQDHLLRKL